MSHYATIVMRSYWRWGCSNPVASFRYSSPFATVLTEMDFANPSRSPGVQQWTR